MRREQPVSPVLVSEEKTTGCRFLFGYRGTSFIGNTFPIGPYSRGHMVVLGGGAVSYERGTPVGPPQDGMGHLRKDRHASGWIGPPPER